MQHAFVSIFEVCVVIFLKNTFAFNTSFCIFPNRLPLNKQNEEINLKWAEEFQQLPFYFIDKQGVVNSQKDLLNVSSSCSSSLCVKQRILHVLLMGLWVILTFAVSNLILLCWLCSILSSLWTKTWTFNANSVRWSGLETVANALFKRGLVTSDTWNLPFSVHHELSEWC